MSSLRATTLRQVQPESSTVHLFKLQSTSKFQLSSSEPFIPNADVQDPAKCAM